MVQSEVEGWGGRIWRPRMSREYSMAGDAGHLGDEVLWSGKEWSGAK